MFNLAEIIKSITLVSTHYDQHISGKIDNKTKPPGALGQLESLAAQLARVQYSRLSKVADIELTKATIMVFAADHGIAAHSISITPQAVTRQMVLNFIAKGAAINCFCDANDVALKVVDCGILEPIERDDSDFFVSRIAVGSKDFSQQAAMTDEQMHQAIDQGYQLAQTQINQGTNVLGFGEMGIGNTTSASAMLAALTGYSASDMVGLGTGINNEQLQLKVQLVEQALARVNGDVSKPLLALKEFGGFEIAHIVGGMLAAAKAKCTILVDGFIVSTAAFIAVKLAPEVRDYMVFCHASAEKAHKVIMTELQATPLLNLDMRLGEGTGCALAVPLLRSAAAFYNHMASFESANVVL